MHFNKVLQLSDYDELQTEVAWLSTTMCTLRAKGVFTQLNHVHRRWEYGLAKALVDQEGKALTIADTGSGASMLGIGLCLDGHIVWETDSGDYGDPVDRLVHQCMTLGVEIPYVKQPVELMPDVPSDFFDVTLSISLMEHVGVDREKAGWSELVRITKPGGVIFATMDFHPDPTIDTPFRECQQTIYNEEHLYGVLDWLDCDSIDEPNWEYHGNLVNNYSFCTLAVRK